MFENVDKAGNYETCRLDINIINKNNIIMTNVELAKYGESPNEGALLIYGILVILALHAGFTVAKLEG